MRKVLLFLFSHRTLAVLRWDLHFLKVRLRNSLFRRRRGIEKRIANAPRPVYLNLGSGPRGNTDPHWINVDGFADTNVHFEMDFTRRWPFGDHSFDGIFCEHVFEHFDLEHGEAVLREAFRVLRPGGSLRMIVPDGEKLMKAYFEQPGELINRRPATGNAPIDSINSYFRQRYEHQFIYDWPLLAAELKKAGFDEVLRASFRKTNLDSQICLDDPKYEWESLYVEARKQNLIGNE